MVLRTEPKISYTLFKHTTLNYSRSFLTLPSVHECMDSWLTWVLRIQTQGFLLTKEALLPAETLAMRVGVRDQWWLLPQSFSTLLFLRQALSLNLEPIGSASRLHRVLQGSSYLPCAGFSGWSCGSPCLCGQHLLSACLFHSMLTELPRPTFPRIPLERCFYHQVKK